jgi:hypothetical protein
VSHRLSLSRYALALKCSYWARPELEWKELPAGKAARIGTLVHRMAEAHAKRRDLLPQAADAAELVEAIRIFNGPLKTWVEVWRDAPADYREAEMRLRYDAATDSVHSAPRRDEPGYTRPGETEVTGELDFVTVRGDEAEVVDLKTGSPRNSNEEQLHGYGLLVSRKWRHIKRVKIAFLYALKTKLTLTPWVTLDVDRLDAEAGKMARTLRRLPLARPVTGDYCDYRCPMGRALCPAWGSQEETQTA